MRIGNVELKVNMESIRRLNMETLFTHWLVSDTPDGTFTKATSHEIQSRPE